MGEERERKEQLKKQKEAEIAEEERKMKEQKEKEKQERKEKIRLEIEGKVKHKAEEKERKDKEEEGEELVECSGSQSTGSKRLNPLRKAPSVDGLFQTQEVNAAFTFKLPPEQQQQPKLSFQLPTIA